MDEREFDEFYAASFRRITNQVYAIIGDRDEATECVQEAFVRAWAHRRTFNRTEHPEAWIRTTAYRHAVSRWRKHARRRRPFDGAIGPDTRTGPPDEHHVVLVDALKQLPEAQRQALVLHHLADLPVHAVAQEVGVPVGTIKARLSRGRRALAALLAESPHRPGPGISRGVGHV